MGYEKRKLTRINYYIIVEKRFSGEHTKNPNANVPVRPDVTFWAVQKDKLGLGEGGGDVLKLCFYFLYV